MKRLYKYGKPKRCCVCQSHFAPRAAEGEAAHVCIKCVEMLKGTAHAGGKGFLKGNNE